MVPVKHRVAMNRTLYQQVRGRAVLHGLGGGSGKMVSHPSPLKPARPSKPLTQARIGGFGGLKTNFVNIASFSFRRRESKATPL